MASLQPFLFQTMLNLIQKKLQDRVVSQPGPAGSPGETLVQETMLLLRHSPVASCPPSVTR